MSGGPTRRDALARITDASRRWPWWRWQLAYLATGSLTYTHPAPWMATAPWPSRALLPLHAACRPAVLLPTSREWWSVAWWGFVAGPFYRTAYGIGALDVADGDRYRNGRWRWDIWRAGRPWGA